MNHYRLELPAVVAFSGGRTSGYMLRHILDAFDGVQPDDLKVCFQNTGLEHKATYQFVEDCAKNWGARITWLKYTTGPNGKPETIRVNGQSASRTGEPFDRLIEAKGYLPNPVSRVCTSNLKMRTQDRYLRSLPDFADGYTNALGLRYDEPRRAQRVKSDNGRESIVCPLYLSGVTEHDVLKWWGEQSFDLNLPMKGNTAGNCVGCFLKSRHKLDALMREMPEYFTWWVRAEERASATAGSGARFRLDRPSYATLVDQVSRQHVLPFTSDEEDDSLPCGCHD
tara:strand:- start:1214 stop:2059 length:846 start_codon:yes stop_codon:yes gene_type:complete